jgi:hypothetical protein
MNQINLRKTLFDSFKYIFEKVLKLTVAERVIKLFRLLGNYMA